MSTCMLLIIKLSFEEGIERFSVDYCGRNDWVLRFILVYEDMSCCWRCSFVVKTLTSWCVKFKIAVKFETQFRVHLEAGYSIYPRLYQWSNLEDIISNPKCRPNSKSLKFSNSISFKTNFRLCQNFPQSRKYAFIKSNVMF